MIALSPSVERTLATALWITAVVVIALGGAGLVTAMRTTADDPTRSGRTARDDAAVVAHLEPIEAQLRDLADATAELGSQARGALAALSGDDQETAEAAVERGGELLVAIESRRAAISTALGAVPVVDTPEAIYRLSSEVRDRHDRASEAVAVTRDLAPDWQRLTDGALLAARLSRLLAEHDVAVGRAAARGRAADYDAALAILDEADAAIAAARTMRDGLVATVDVTTLDEWLARSERYDRALRDLYVAVRDADGRITEAVREAVREEQAAKARLPPDTRALVLIMAEIGRGGMTEAASAIDRARDDLVEALDPPAVPSPS